MAKVFLWQYKHEDGIVGNEQWQYYCPGCKHIHGVGKDMHKFNGDLEKPTFTPSLVNNFIPGQMCHSYITDGNIQFLDDCTHELKGQMVELPQIEPYT